MRILLSYITPYKRYFFFAYLAILASSGAILAFGKGLSTLIDEGLLGDSAGLGPLVWIVVLVFIIAICSFLRLWFCGKGAECVVRNLRLQLYNKIITLSPSVLGNTSTATLMTRLMADTSTIQEVLNGSVLVIFRNITVLTSSICMLLHTNMQLTLRTALVIPVLLLIVVFWGKRVKKAGLFLREKTDKLAYLGEETCRGISAIQALVAEEHMKSKFTDVLVAASEATHKYVLLRAVFVALIIASVTGSVGLVLWIGLKAVVANSVSAGTLLSFIFYSALAAGAVNGLGDNMHELQKASGVACDISVLLNTDSGMKDNDNCEEIHDVSESVDINNVTFYYPGKRGIAVLKNITLSIKRGENIAIVGHSGSGKTTILDLLLRFYDVSEGSITIDGKDIRNISLKSLRSLFCVVPQSPVVFSGTMLDNITYGVRDFTDEQLQKAIEGASIADFVNSLPDKLNTFVGEKGMCLSEGQRQRIVIARAMLRCPKVLILDEATSALDSDNEYRVQNVLREMMRGKLTITIAHRLSTVVDADKIVVMHNGTVHEVGTHNELMQDDNSVYSRMFKLQHRVGEGI